ncbi:CoxG family protein [Pseudomonadota bacterium]
MDLSGEIELPAPRQQVWEALNDPEILKQCIPGCNEFEKISDTEFEAQITAKVGPVKAKFVSKVTLDELKPPQSYTLIGEGKGGIAGFAKGNVEVELVEEGEGTLLKYTSAVQIGGKLAQVGSRLFSSAAKKWVAEFFSAFEEVVS